MERRNADRAKDAARLEAKQGALRHAAQARLAADGPPPFLLNSDFSVAYGLIHSHSWDSAAAATEVAGKAAADAAADADAAAAADGAAVAATLQGGAGPKSEPIVSISKASVLPSDSVRAATSAGGDAGSVSPKRLDHDRPAIDSAGSVGSGSSLSTVFTAGSSGPSTGDVRWASGKPASLDKDAALSSVASWREPLPERLPRAPSHALRLRLMMGAYRGARTFGVLENKLLASSAMSKLGLPSMEVVYGAMAHTALGEWPVYTKEGMASALLAGGYGATNGFVVKPASDGTNYGLLLMTAERWNRENWTYGLVCRHVERFLYKPRSSWGQWYEQRGVVVQELYTDDAPQSARWPRGLAEMNVLVHLGYPVHMRVMQIPKAASSGCFDVRLHVNGSYECLPSATCPDPIPTCLKYGLRFHQVLPEVGAYARRLATFFGADWFRFDYFYGHPRRPIRVNEVSYPSHHTYPPDIRGAWLAAYAQSVPQPSPDEGAYGVGGASGSWGGGHSTSDVASVVASGAITKVMSAGVSTASAALVQSAPMLQVPSSCVMQYLYEFVGIPPGRFEKLCFLCRPSPPGGPPYPPSPWPPSMPPSPPSKRQPLPPHARAPSPRATSM